MLLGLRRVGSRVRNTGGTLSSFLGPLLCGLFHSLSLFASLCIGRRWSVYVISFPATPSDCPESQIQILGWDHPIGPAWVGCSPLVQRAAAGRWGKVVQKWLQRTHSGRAKFLKKGVTMSWLDTVTLCHADFLEWTFPELCLLFPEFIIFQCLVQFYSHSGGIFNKLIW